MKQVCIVCLHLLQTPEIPCVEILNDPLDPRDSGKTFLCVPCDQLNRRSLRTRQKPGLSAEQLATVCAHHCDAMTITETIDARS